MNEATRDSKLWFVVEMRWRCYQTILFLNRSVILVSVWNYFLRRCAARGKVQTNFHNLPLLYIWRQIISWIFHLIPLYISSNSRRQLNWQCINMVPRGVTIRQHSKDAVRCALFRSSVSSMVVLVRSKVFLIIPKFLSEYSTFSWQCAFEILRIEGTRVCFVMVSFRPKHEEFATHSLQKNHYA